MGNAEEFCRVHPLVSLSRTSNISEDGRLSSQSLGKYNYLDMTMTNPPMSCKALSYKLIALNALEWKEPWLGARAIIFGEVQPIYAISCEAWSLCFFYYQWSKLNIFNFCLENMGNFMLRFWNLSDFWLVKKCWFYLKAEPHYE